MFLKKSYLLKGQPNKHRKYKPKGNNPAGAESRDVTYISVRHISAFLSVNPFRKLPKSAFASKLSYRHCPNRSALSCWHRNCFFAKTLIHGFLK